MSRVNLTCLADRIMFSPTIKKQLNQLNRYCRTHEHIFAVPKDEAEFLFQLIKIKKPKKILELGTSVGFSTVYLGLAAKEYGGKIITVEKDKRKIGKIKTNLRKFELEKTVKVINEEALKIIKKLKGNFDFIFLDAVKQEYLAYLKALEKKLTKQAIIAADNAIDFKSKMVDYLKYVRNNKKYHSTLIPFSNGLEITIKL